MTKYLIQTHDHGPKVVATISKEGPFDQREGASWEVLNACMAATEADAIRAVLREWTGGQV